MNTLSSYVRQGLLIAISALVALQGIDAQRFISIEKELIEMTEEVYVEVSIAESKKTNLSKIKRPFNGFLHCKTAIAEFVKDTSSESPLQHLPKLHLRNRVFLI
ncbi:MAG: hypothetical protein ACK5RG_18365 [Cyclobacteriaceae bacterium]|jgi:hypothetical protein|nr:hypothetical protein [Flammeovirgaceae bacterium]